MRVLVTGGAGYIGSHTVRRLQHDGHEPVVYDNLCQGHRAAVRDCPLVEGDTGDVDLLKSTMIDARTEVVIHFAAHCSVSESVEDPAKYYRNNVANGIILLEAMLAAGVGRIVFSSTAATYGVPTTSRIEESHPKNPCNPYGLTKLHFEHILADYARTYGTSSIALRYFNAAGASLSGDIGEDHVPERHLIPIVLQVALGQREQVQIHGTDYDTPDGTCVRDYIHVEDIADAHVRAMAHMPPGAAMAYNLGNGRPYSVREVIDTAREITGHPIPAQEAPRRPGDPLALVASPAKIMAELGWRPQLTNLHKIVETAWQWHQTHPQGYGHSLVRGVS